jgi:yecA family protein
VSYRQLSETLQAAALPTGAAEAHGVFCGMLCGGLPHPEPDWIGQLLESADARDLRTLECERALRTLAATTRDAIDGPGLGFSPLLPDEDAPLPERAAGLRDWCQGFLYGLGLSGTHDRTLSAETAEALHDLAEVARLDSDLQDSDEAHEEAYSEVAEFVWVAAMLIHEERARAPEHRP